jgi:K+-transporting ATPase ATPase A chain
VTVSGWTQIVIVIVALTALTPLLGGYMARVYQGQPVVLSPLCAPLERVTYRLLLVARDEEQSWKAYARSLLAFSLVSWLALYSRSEPALPRATGSRSTSRPRSPSISSAAPWIAVCR